MKSSLVGKLALVVAILGLGGSLALADFTTANNPQPVTIVSGDAANVTIGGKPYKPGMMVTNGQQIKVTGADTVLKIGTTQITASAGTTLNFDAGTHDSNAQHVTASTFAVAKGSISYRGKTLEPGTVLSTEEDQAFMALSTAAQNNQEKGTQNYRYKDIGFSLNETLVFAPPSPEKNLTVLSPSTP